MKEPQPAPPFHNVKSFCVCVCACYTKTTKRESWTGGRMKKCDIIWSSIFKKGVICVLDSLRLYFLIIHQYFLLNIELIYKQKQCLIDALYQIAKGIIKTALNFMYFLFLKIKNNLMSGFIQLKENFSPTKFSRVFFCIKYHHHHVAPSAWISLPLSHYPSLSSIASSRSSGLHPVSAHSCCK